MYWTASLLTLLSLVGVAQSTPTNTKRYQQIITGAKYPAPLVQNNGSSWNTTDGFFPHDPSIIQRVSDGKYFLFATHGNLTIFQSDSLAGPWIYQGKVLPEGSKIDFLSGDPWAPDVSYWNGSYYCFYCASTLGNQNSAIGLAISPNLEPGTWEDLGLILRSSDASPADLFNAIDPHLAFNQTGAPFLFWGSFWSDIFSIELRSDLQSVPLALSPTQVSINTTSPQAEEGSFVYYHEPYFHLFVSAGICCGFNVSALPLAGAEYHILSGRSSSIQGPYVDSKGVPLLESGGDVLLTSHGDIYAPGGQGVIHDDVTGYDLIYYHYKSPLSPVPYADDYAQLGINRIDWDNGWPKLISW